MKSSLVELKNIFKHIKLNQVWWYKPVIPALGKQRQQDPKLEAGWITLRDSVPKNKTNTMPKIKSLKLFYFSN
jgi:hypothetical protein